MDDPPLIFHPTAEQAPGLETGYSEAFALYRESLAEHIRVLFDRFSFCDMAMKVVGVGSVGTAVVSRSSWPPTTTRSSCRSRRRRRRCSSPMPARACTSNHGQRVVVGQRLMQSASDIFLGWTRGCDGRHYYMRQLRDMKISAIIEGFDP